MPQSSRRPPSYPTPAYAPPPSSSAGGAAAAAPSRNRAPRQPAAVPPAVAPAYAARPQRGVVMRSLGLKLLSVGGILHASGVLMALVVLLVMAIGGDARVGQVIRTIKSASTPIWTWTLCAVAIAFVLGFVMLYNAIGTLSLTPWSQRATKLWAAAWLALATAALLVNLAWVYPMLKDAAPDRFTAARLMLVTCVHVAAGILWPAAVLFYMNTRHVKDTYARVANGAAAM